MTNLENYHTEKVSTITKTLEDMGIFKSVEVSVVGGDIEYNAEGEAYGVDDCVNIQAWGHNQDVEIDYPILDIMIGVGGFISGCPCSEDEYYLDEDGDFDEDKYNADVDERLEALDPDNEERLNFLIQSIRLDDSIGDFSFHIQFHNGLYGGWNAEELDELNAYLQSETFAKEVAIAIADNAEEDAA